jgi:predicted aldo/keto reductase-like oxidoreductase
MGNEGLGKDILKLGFGLMRLPMIGEDIDMVQVEKMVDQFMKAGFTYFDTAYVYHGGQSEVVAREAIVKRYPRDAFQLATKMPVWEAKKYEDYQRLFDIQLDRTGAGYFDYYLLHALDHNRADEIDKMGAWDFVKEMKEKGLIKHIGFSFHDKASSLDDILSKHPEAEFVQLQINYADWENDEVQSRECYEVARKHNKPIIIMEPIKGGSLAVMRPEIQEMFKKVNPDLSIASWAMRFAASLEGVVTVLSGMSNIAQMEDNISHMSNLIPLQEEEKITIKTAVEEIAKIPTIPCTSCKYCVDGCPQKINIPGAFESYNNYKLYQNLDGSKGHYIWVISGGGKASDCISCGSCESHCPQHISIMDTLKEVAGVLE